MAAPRGRWTEIMPAAPGGVTRVRVSETISNPSAASIAASSAGLRQRAPERNRSTLRPALGSPANRRPISRRKR
jgi:hypothetical protein